MTDVWRVSFARIPVSEEVGRKEALGGTGDATLNEQEQRGERDREREREREGEGGRKRGGGCLDNASDT